MVRFIREGRGVLWLCALFLFVLSAFAQEGTINPRIPPPPPPPEQPAPQPAPQPKATEPAPPRKDVRGAETVPPPSVPATVAIPAGTQIAVVLDTPLSTRIARQGQRVIFRTSEPLSLSDQLEIPPETAFTGSVVEVKRPGHFGKPGVLRVKVNRINLATGATAEVAARLDSSDMNGHGRLSSDNNRATDLYGLVMYTLEGTLAGSQIGGGKGAAVGAGAGAALAVLIMSSRRGADVYLEPGMPFLVILDRAVELPGTEVFAAQQSYARARGLSGESAYSSDPGRRFGVNSNNAATGSEIERNPDGAVLDSERPKLKRRPKNPQP